MPDFDGDALLITLDPAPGGVVDVDVQDDLYEPWKDWMRSSSANRKYPPAFRPDGGNPLSSIIDQGRYTFLNNVAGWRIKPYEQDGTWYLTGNLAVEDTALPAFVPTDGDYTAAILGLQPVTQGVTPEMAAQLEYASFQGGVWVNQAGSNSGTGGTNGNAQYPVNNIPDAVSIRNTRGLPSKYYVLGDLVLGSGDSLENAGLYGESAQQTHITINGPADTLGIRIHEASVTGNLDGQSAIHDCILTNLNYINGEIHSCRLEPGTIVLGGSTMAEFERCRSGVPGQTTPTIDCGGDGPPLSMRQYTGGVKLINKTGSAAVSIDLSSGQVLIDLATVTDGEIVVRGDGKVFDTQGNHLGTGTYGNLQLYNEANFGEHLHDVWRGMGFDPTEPGTHTPEEIAKFVWNAYLADHTTTDTFGYFVQKKLLTFARWIGNK